MRARRIRIIHALALAHRIECQHHVAQAHEALAASLVHVVRLAVVRMPHLKQHRGIWRHVHRRDVKIGGDVKLWPALVENFLDVVTVAPERADLLHLEGCALRLAAHELPKRFAHPPLPGCNQLGCFETGDLIIAALIRLPRQLAKIIRQASRIIAIRHARK